MASLLPASVLNLVEMSPVEDLLLSLLRDGIPDVPINTLVKAEQTFPFVQIRSTGSWGDWSGDPRFLDASTVEIYALCDGINADSDANLLSEAVRVVMRDSVNKVVPGKGHIVKHEMNDRPKRSSDWASTAGDVQYAELPAGVQRWESTHRVVIRKPVTKPFAQ